MQQHSAFAMRGRWTARLRDIVLRPFDWLLRLVGPRYRLFLWIMTHVPPRAIARLGRARAARARDHAARRVPAYRDFAGSPPAPWTDKENYVRAYGTEQRCVDGTLVFRDTAIDESSGSTGTPYNWVRSQQERVASHIFISHFARYCFGTEPWITINAFSMGAWATGLNMGIALQRNSIVKSTGPNLDKIFSTLEFFGTGTPYLICGYPPFLKLLIDEAGDRGISLDDYRLMALVGGEGMSEGLRDYLLTAFRPVFSGYGATDLEIGIAGESPISVALRREARRNDRLRQALFGDDSRLPMIFQYNPLQHDVTVTADRELVFTISRLEMLSPRVDYNIHDEGGVATFADIRMRTALAGVDLASLVDDEEIPRLPFLWVYGRSDSTVSVMGANIYPEDIEHCLYEEPDLARITTSYCLGLREGEDGAATAVVSFEVGVPIDSNLEAEFDKRIVDALEALNRDFRSAMAEHPEGARPLIQLWEKGTGPFAADEGKIKQRRLVADQP